MALAKRVVLFLLTNFLVIAAISFIMYFFNLQPFLRAHGLDYTSLAIFCLLWGMGGALISLALSKVMAKWMMSIQIIDPNTREPALRQLYQIVEQLSRRAGLPVTPEVGIYQSPEVNAFATGPTRRSALVAVSAGMLQRMNPEEIEAVLGHEISHVANGDMVTMTLLQGVINAFVMFLARILAFALSRLMIRGQDDSEGGFSPLVFQLTVFALEIVFMILGSIVIAAFSRWREYRADAGGARLAGTQKMIAALLALKRTVEIKDERAQHPAFQSLKIADGKGFLLTLFASHPPLDARIARLQSKDRAL
jgi:heat shock protein HtpX